MTPRLNTRSRLIDRLLIVSTVVCLLSILISATAIVTADEPVGSRPILGHAERDWLPSKDARQLGDYWLSYDGRSRSARYVVEFLRPSDKDVVERFSGFSEDPDAPPEARAADADYAGTIWDRGHLAASDNHKGSQRAQRETFRLSNVAPQWPRFNRGAWRSLEQSIRTQADATECVVITAPLYLPNADGMIVIETIGESRVWIPTHFGKAVLSTDPAGSVTLRCWILPNNDIGSKPLDDFRVTGDAFEAALGCDLWAVLPDPTEHEIEREAR